MKMMTLFLSLSVHIKIVSFQLHQMHLINY